MDIVRRHTVSGENLKGTKTAGHDKPPGSFTKRDRFKITSTTSASAARDEARQQKDQRNARVEAWRVGVARTASECTCTSSSVPSSESDALAAAAAAAANAAGNGRGSSGPRLAGIGASTGGRGTSGNGTCHGTTTSDGAKGSLRGIQEKAEDELLGFAYVCHNCARLGAPLFMGQSELGEDVAGHTKRRSSSMGKALRSISHRFSFASRRKSKDKGIGGDAGWDPESEGPEKQGDKDPRTRANRDNSSIVQQRDNRNYDLEKTSGPKPRESTHLPPPLSQSSSADSFLESRKAKMKRNKLTLKNSRSAAGKGQEGARERAKERGLSRQDLHQVNDILSPPPTRPAATKRHLQLDGQCPIPSPHHFAASPPPVSDLRGPFHTVNGKTQQRIPRPLSDFALASTLRSSSFLANLPSPSLSPSSPATSVAEGAQDPFAAHQAKQAQRGAARLDRAQKLLDKQEQGQKPPSPSSPPPPPQQQQQQQQNRHTHSVDAHTHRDEETSSVSRDAARLLEGIFSWEGEANGTEWSERPYERPFLT